MALKIRLSEFVEKLHSYELFTFQARSQLETPHKHCLFRLVRFLGKTIYFELQGFILYK